MSVVTLLNLDGSGAIGSVEVETTTFNVLLGVVPSATRVGGGEGNLDTGHNAASEDTVSGLVTKEEASKERGNNDEDAGSDHLFEGSVGGDRDAPLVVSRLTSLFHMLELSADFPEHVLGGITDGLHGHGGEPVGEHGTDEESSEGVRLKDVDTIRLLGLDSGFIGFGHDSDGAGNTGHEGTEEGEGNEAGGSNGETLADSGGGVACGIESISSLTDDRFEVAHLSDSTGVVGDGAIAVNGEGNGEAAEHANSGKGNSVHGSELEGNKHGDGKAEDGDDAREVTKGETVDDVGGASEFASLSKLLGRSVFFGGVVFSDEADSETGPETKHDAGVALPSGGVEFVSSEHDVGTLEREHVNGRDDHDAHENGGNPQLDLQGSLNVVGFNVGEELADERGNDSDGRDDKREVDGLRGVAHALGGGGNDQSGTGRLSEGSEKIGAHTSNVTNVITDVVSNSAWVLRGVLGDVAINLTGEIGTDISSLGVNTTTDSSEESDGGATETVSRDELKEMLDLHVGCWVEGSLVGKDEDLKDEESEADEAESEDLTALEGDNESFESVPVAKIGGLDVGDGSNDHADVATKHGGAGTDEEGEHGEGEFVLVNILVPWHVDGTEDNDGEERAEDGQCCVFFFEESDGTLEKLI